MATSKDKFQLIFEAQDAASKEIRQLNTQLAALGGPRMVKSQKEIKRLEREIKFLSGTTTKSKGIFTRFTKGIAAGNIIANAATGAFNMLRKGIGQIGTATMVAANVEELSGVLQFLGKQAGYTSTEISDYVMQLRKSGIAQKESNQALLRAIQGNIKLADAVKLGRIAQDAAVIGQMNSSEAYETLIDAIVKGRVVMLKSLGIQGTFQAEYKKLAQSLGKAQTELTETEKLQARMNLVMAGGEVIAGAYTTAMGSASKQLRSMDRLVQDLQVSVGQYLVPSLSVVVIELSNMTKAMTSSFSGDAADSANDMATNIGIFTANVVFAAKAVTNFGQIVFDVISMGVIAPIESGITAFHALSAALSDPFNMDAWKHAGTIMEDVFDGFETDFDDIVSNIEDIDNALLNYEKTVAKLGAPKVTADIDSIEGTDPTAGMKDNLASIPAMLEETDDLIEEEVKLATAGMADVAAGAASSVASTGQQMQNMMGSAIGSMVDNMVTGRASFGEIFKGIAQDFMIFFIKQALSMVVSMFIPGLGSLLGGIFDTPANDRMAATQGKDFMQWFTRGAIAEAQGGSTMAVGISQASNRIAPVAASGGGGGGTIMMNVTVSGNVLTDAYVEKTIAPKLRRLVADGRSLLSIQSENKTGGRDVSIT